MFGAISEGLFGSPSTNKEHANEKNAVYAGEPVGTPQELTLAVEFPSFPPIPYHVQVWPWETIAPSLARVTRNKTRRRLCHAVVLLPMDAVALSVVFGMVHRCYPLARRGKCSMRSVLRDRQDIAAL